MKYTKDIYESATYFKRYNRCDFRRQQKIVRARFDHKCALCDCTISSYSYCLNIKELFPKTGWIRTWICLKCCNRWIEATHQEGENT